MFEEATTKSKKSEKVEECTRNWGDSLLGPKTNSEEDCLDYIMYGNFEYFLGSGVSHIWCVDLEKPNEGLNRAIYFLENARKITRYLVNRPKITYSPILKQSQVAFLPKSLYNALVNVHMANSSRDLFSVDYLLKSAIYEIKSYLGKESS